MVSVVCRLAGRQLATYDVYVDNTGHNTYVPHEVGKVMTVTVHLFSQAVALALSCKHGMLSGRLLHLYGQIHNFGELMLFFIKDYLELTYQRLLLGFLCKYLPDFFEYFL